MINKVKELMFEEEAQGMVEYILIIAVVALVVVAAVRLFGSKIAELFNAKGEELKEFEKKGF